MKMLVYYKDFLRQKELAKGTRPWVVFCPMSDGSTKPKANYRAEFFGGPMDGHCMFLAVPAGNFVFVIGGITWDYALVSVGDLLRYELVRTANERYS